MRKNVKGGDDRWRRKGERKTEGREGDTRQKLTPIRLETGLETFFFLFCVV